MMDNKLVSIIVPIYNGEKYIQRLVESVLLQTYKNIQLILVDDGSTDNSFLLCEQYARKDSRINVLHQDNRGVSVARNSGLKVAQGAYITFIDVDDYIDSDYIMRLSKYANDEVLVISDDTVELDGFLVDGLNVISYILNHWSACMKLYPKDSINGVKFLEGVFIAEDLQFSVDVILNGGIKKIHLIKGGYHYVNNNDSAMHKSDYKKFLTGLMTEINCLESLKTYGYSLKENPLVLNGAYYVLKYFWSQDFNSIISNYYEYKKIKKITKKYMFEIFDRREIDRKKFLLIIGLLYFPWLGFFFIKMRKH